MNILILSYYRIYPPTTGGGIAQFATLEYLSNICNISLLICEKFSLSHEELSRLRYLLPKVKIYNLDHFPSQENNQEIGTSNIVDKSLHFLWTSLRQLKYFLKHIIFTKRDKKKDISKESEFEIFFSPNQFFTHSKRLIDTINRIITEDKIDIVQIEFYVNLNLVTAIPSSVKKVFISHELMFARIQSHINARKTSSPYADYVLMLNKTIELSFVEKFDAVISFSEHDSSELKNSLAEHGSKIKFATIPFAVLDQDFQEISKNSFKTINKLVFIGAESHFPNKDAVEWFLEEAATEIFLRFGLRLYVIGSWSKQTVAKYQHHPSRVCFTGFVENIYDVLKNSISIAPVRIGGGIQSKVLVSMAQGIPVICSEFAAIGINVKHLESVMLGENKNSFCESVQCYIENPHNTFLICQKAQQIVKQQYSQAVISQLRYKFYQDCLS